MSTKQSTTSVKFDKDFEFWTKGAHQMMRYEVLCFDVATGEPLMGIIVTNMKLDDFFTQNGLSLGVIHSKGPARPGEETNLV